VCGQCSVHHECDGIGDVDRFALIVGDEQGGDIRLIVQCSHE